MMQLSNHFVKQCFTAIEVNVQIHDIIWNGNEAY